MTAGTPRSRIRDLADHFRVILADVTEIGKVRPRIGLFTVRGRPGVYVVFYDDDRLRTRDRALAAFAPDGMRREVLASGNGITIVGVFDVDDTLTIADAPDDRRPAFRKHDLDDL